MKIYTKFGDTGESALYGGTRLEKDAPQFEAIGTVDELNAYIGYAQTLIGDADLSALLARVQNHLFAVGADLATPMTHTKSAENANTWRFHGRDGSCDRYAFRGTSTPQEFHSTRWMSRRCYFTHCARRMPPKRTVRSFDSHVKLRSTRKYFGA